MRNFTITIVFAIGFATLTGSAVVNHIDKIVNGVDYGVFATPCPQDAIIVGWLIISILSIFTIYLIGTSIYFFKNRE